MTRLRIEAKCGAEFTRDVASGERLAGMLHARFARRCGYCCQSALKPCPVVEEDEYVYEDDVIQEA